MTFKFGLREGALSAAVFGGVMFALVSVDPRVRDHVSDLARRQRQRRAVDRSRSASSGARSGRRPAIRASTTRRCSCSPPSAPC